MQNTGAAADICCYIVVIKGNLHKWVIYYQHTVQLSGIAKNYRSIQSNMSEGNIKHTGTALDSYSGDAQFKSQQGQTLY